MSARARDEVVVHVDMDPRGPSPAGRLRRAGMGQRADLSFEYAPDWLDTRKAFSLEPSLNLTSGDQRRVGGGLFGILSDAAPDLWGRRLLERREVYLAKREGRRARTLDEWDFLVGVNDATRMGALRFARPSTGAFVDDQPLAVPPKTTLRDLESIAARLERGASASDRELGRWLEQLIGPGASLGGARPKATFQDTTGVLWIAKFPSANDRRDVGAWEYVQTQLAERAGIAVPRTDLLSLGEGYRTFAAERFDRESTHRRMFASAMTLLDERDHARGVSYLDIASAIERYGGRTKAAIDADLEELFRRVVFNALAGNRDDHLRNHGFLHDGKGWRLAPAFDLNPIPDKHEHELSFDATSTLPDLAVIEGTARLYRLSGRRAQAVITEVKAAVGSWRTVARAAGIPRDEQELMAAAYLEE
ncbi:MAG: type II toxin-antitoxin system HipA family toxin [Candidatus Limnocylindria bacterium]|nr:type II toxin-antitoxin system HipA family toxin [Candidatus Limnocylindria bacterium]